MGAIPKRFNYLLMLILLFASISIFLLLFTPILSETNKVLVPTSNKKLFVAFHEPGAGYGNRMYTVLSGLTISILTDRKVVIDWPEVKGFVKESVPFWSYRSQVKMNMGKIKQLKPDLTNIWKPEKNIREIIKTRVEYDQEEVLFGNNAAYFFEICSNPDYYEKLYQLGLVKKETIKAARNTIEQMPQETNNSILIDRIYLVGNKKNIQSFIDIICQRYRSGNKEKIYVIYNNFR